MTDLEGRAEKIWDWDKNKAVPLHLLLAWLSDHTDHGGHDAKVPHGELEAWAKSVAVKRVVDHGPSHDEKDVWHFFEHGWHKAGAACETHLTQSRARLVRGPDAEGMSIFETSKETAEKIQEGMVGGMSIDAGKITDGPITAAMIAAKSGPHKVYPKVSSTTGREHLCELPPEETCYWSGDPYASHELGF